MTPTCPGQAEATVVHLLVALTPSGDLFDHAKDLFDGAISPVVTELLKIARCILRKFVLASTHPPLAPPKEAGPEVSEVRPKLACPRSDSETSITLAAKPG